MMTFKDPDRFAAFDPCVDRKSVGCAWMVAAFILICLILIPDVLDALANLWHLPVSGTATAYLTQSEGRGDQSLLTSVTAGWRDQGVWSFCAG